MVAAFIAKVPLLGEEALVVMEQRGVNEEEGEDFDVCVVMVAFFI